MQQDGNEGKEQFVIRDLDTGTEYVIGETDPTFEFDTFSSIVDADAVPVSPTSDSTMSKATFLESAWLSITTGVAWLFGLRDIDDQLNTINEAEDDEGGENDETGYAAGNNPSKEGDDASGDASGSNNRQDLPSIHDFQFVKDLGRGAFGQVVLVRHKQDCALYAVKILEKSGMRSSDKRQAKIERDVLATMSRVAPHPFTVSLKFAFQSPNKLYLGMTFLPGGDLKSHLRKFGRFPEVWVRFLTAEIVLALSHLHSMNVLYRDLKPHNVMLDREGHICLVDYGLAKTKVRHPRGAQSLVGTPDYSAPEVLRTGAARIQEAQQRQQQTAADLDPVMSTALAPTTTSSSSLQLGPIGYGKAADWWSLGVMIFEMQCGFPPFRGRDLRDTYKNVLSSPIRFPTRTEADHDIRYAKQKAKMNTEVFESSVSLSLSSSLATNSQSSSSSSSTSSRDDEEVLFSKNAENLISRLLERDASIRLGAWGTPPIDIQSHPYFNCDWNLLQMKQVTPPFKPKIDNQITNLLDEEEAAKLRNEREDVSEKPIRNFDSVMGEKSPSPDSHAGKRVNGKVVQKPAQREVETRLSNWSYMDATRDQEELGGKIEK